jgi:sortase A
MRHFLGATGRVLLTTGILLLLFVAYQLWGTGIYEARAQSRLRTQLENQLERHGQMPLGATTTTVPDDPIVSTTPPTTVPPPPLAPENGDAMGFIRIDKIGLGTGDPEAVVEGVDVDDLRQGAGHYPTTPMPGQEGNTAIAGHRTTYGAPFRKIDELRRGEPVNVDMPDGRFVYRVQRTKIVDDQDLSVLGEVGYQRLVLSACHPLYSAAQRVIVFARFVRREPPRVRQS